MGKNFFSRSPPATHLGLLTVAICMGVLKLDGSGLPEVRLIYMYAKLRAPSLILTLGFKAHYSVPSSVSRSPTPEWTASQRTSSICKL
jgi:hypothetical protein